MASVIIIIIMIPQTDIKVNNRAALQLKNKPISLPLLVSTVRVGSHTRPMFNLNLSFSLEESPLNSPVFSPLP